MFCPNCTEQEMNEDRHGNKECNECSYYISGNGKTDAEIETEKLRARVDELESYFRGKIGNFKGYCAITLGVGDIRKLLEKDWK